jgi:(1->4)-alpha-D-glucan 1-alpha-D-glucosylmutase
MMVRSRIPLACYRLQFNGDFPFRKAQEALPYLSRLGITDVYASPLLQSRTGSNHGYDVVDSTRIDGELGSEEQFENFLATLQQQGMGLLLDIVPNHMAASPENPWWMDVLENGPASPYAAYFDIDWRPPSLSLENKILLPVLGSHYGEALNRREFEVIFRRGSFFVKYGDMLLPLTPKSYGSILKHQEHVLEKKLGKDSPAYQEYLGITAALAALPERTALSMDAAGERRLHVEEIKERLRKLYETSREMRQFLAANLRGFNGRKNQPGSFRELDRLLSDQAFVLAYWQNVNEGINYRRFFTITDLVGMRVEDPIVFEATHRVVFQLMERAALTGLRVDHIDGLRDPQGYLQRLQEQAASSEKKKDAGGIYLLVEKILSADEQLPKQWPVEGTTGYEFLNAANRIFVHAEGARQVEKNYFRFIGRDLNYADVVYQKKKLVMSTLLAVEMRYLGRQLGVLSQSDRYARDFSRVELAQALIEVTACLEVYRTYIRSMAVPAEATRRIAAAVNAARARNPRLDAGCFGFLQDVLLLKDAVHLFPGQREARLAFVMRWQQFTGPIVAKGLEDTVLYVYNPLISLNEVGGNPSAADVLKSNFDHFVRSRRRGWRYGLNSTSTHDTKRGEDVRARINVISEIPREWQRHLNFWARANARKKGLVDGRPAPDRNEEHFLYQTLIGAWPLDEAELPNFRARMEAYMIKAVREAMVHTRWTLPSSPHERALADFIAAILKTTDDGFLTDFLKFQRKIAKYGMVNGLAQTLVKMTSPGVPDFYQGCDLWDLRLVDPDNRGPVDFKLRAALLNQIEQEGAHASTRFARELTRNWEDGRIKLYLIWKTLQLRRAGPKVFLDGQFEQLGTRGTRRDNLVAHALRRRDNWIVSVVPRWLARERVPVRGGRVRAFWRRTRMNLPAGAPAEWTNMLTGEEVRVRKTRRGAAISASDLFANFPVALLKPAASDA